MLLQGLKIFALWNSQSQGPLNFLFICGRGRNTQLLWTCPFGVTCLEDTSKDPFII